jgi:hypothetical protein
VVDHQHALARFRAKKHNRNTGGLISHAATYFASARLEGLMAVYARPLVGRSVQIELGPKHSERPANAFSRGRSAEAIGRASPHRP